MGSLIEEDRVNRLLMAVVLVGSVGLVGCSSGDDNPAGPTNLIIEDRVIGTGATAANGDTVTVHYVGTLQDGTKFDSSYDANRPFAFKVGVGQVIQGWDLGIPGMRVGGKRRLTIPPSLAYGNRANGPIPANSTLIFDIELLSVLGK
jgi:FKBP-type peptidyl-prolyl cis-trans isomerase